MKAHTAEEPGPEQPPPFERRIVLEWKQAAGIAMLVLVPVLALLSLLGDRTEKVETRSGAWRLAGDFPVLARNGESLQITLHLTHDAMPSASRQVTLEVSADYLADFTDVRARPAITSISSHAVKLLDEHTMFEGVQTIIDLTPRRWGRSHGWVRATTDTGERLELTLNTMVLP